MTFRTTFDSYYGRLVSGRKNGHPTVREARADYSRATDAQMSALLFRI